MKSFQRTFVFPQNCINGTRIKKLEGIFKETSTDYCIEEWDITSENNLQNTLIALIIKTDTSWLLAEVALKIGAYLGPITTQQIYLESTFKDDLAVQNNCKPEEVKISE